MKAIIFGINGQDGYYLTELLKRNQIEVIGVSRSNQNWTTGNVDDLYFVENLVKQTRPDFIFHLAAESSTRHSAVFENHNTISTGTLNILESVYRHSLHTKVFLSGSGLQFENKSLPITENDAFDASSPYCVSRIQSVYAGRYYRTLGLKIYIGYFFNHDSPLRSERHVNKKIVNAAKRISEGSREKLIIGDVSVKKEFTYAGDTVEAIWALVNNESVFETVIGSGKAYSIADWIELCFGWFNLKWQEHTITDDNFKSEYRILYSDPATLKKLGWIDKVSIGELVKIMIEHE